MRDASNIAWDLIADTLAGEQGDGNQDRLRADQDTLERWLAEQPAHRRLFILAQRVWETDASLTVPDVALLKAQVSARIGVDVDEHEERTDWRVYGTTGTAVNRSSVGQHRRPAWQHAGRSGWYALAGASVAAVLIVVGWQLGAAKVLGRLSASKPAYTTYVTTNGQRANITLPDGNMVALSVASRLEVPTNYSVGNHVLRLPVGEALFTVSHHAGAPFTVIAGAVTARVLGTSFMVRHYATDSVAMVAVAEGKVGVDNAVVSARHMAEVGRTGTLHMHPVDASAFTFVSGVLPLGATRLSDAIPELDRWYDADVRLGDPSLAIKQIEGTVRAGSLADLTELLRWTCEVRVVRDGRVLTLYPKAK